MKANCTCHNCGAPFYSPMPNARCCGKRCHKEHVLKGRKLETFIAVYRKHKIGDWK